MARGGEGTMPVGDTAAHGGGGSRLAFQNGRKGMNGERGVLQPA
jgi:hypothetical protein